MIELANGFVTNILNYLLSKNLGGKPYYKSIAKIYLDNMNNKTCMIPLNLIEEVIKTIEYYADYDKLSRFGNFYYMLKQLVKLEKNVV